MYGNAAAQKRQNNGFLRDEHFEAVANIEELFQNAILLDHKKTLFQDVFLKVITC